MDRLKLIDDLVKEISENKAKIIDDFFKAYIASRIDEKGFKKKIHKLIIVEKRVSTTVTEYSIQVKKGRDYKLTN